MNYDEFCKFVFSTTFSQAVLDDDEDEEVQTTAPVPQEDPYMVLEDLRQTTELFHQKNNEYMDLEAQTEASKKVLCSGIAPIWPKAL